MSGSRTKYWNVEVPKYTIDEVMAAALALVNRLCVISNSPNRLYPYSQIMRNRIKPYDFCMTLVTIMTHVRREIAVLTTV